MGRTQQLAPGSNLLFSGCLNTTFVYVRQQFPDDDDLPEHVQKLLSFLKRRHGYSLIEFGKLDEAEKVFKSLLDDPTSQDYAVSELAYIQKLKANESPESSEA